MANWDTKSIFENPEKILFCKGNLGIFNFSSSFDYLSVLLFFLIFNF